MDFINSPFFCGAAALFFSGAILGGIAMNWLTNRQAKRAHRINRIFWRNQK